MPRRSSISLSSLKRSSHIVVALASRGLIVSSATMHQQPSSTTSCIVKPFLGLLHEYLLIVHSYLDAALQWITLPTPFTLMIGSWSTLIGSTGPC